VLQSRFFFDLNPAVVNFAGDARHQWRRRSNLLQSIDNEADSVKLATPQGKKTRKNILSGIHLKGEV
jgi:hypothetical protein